MAGDDSTTDEPESNGERDRDRDRDRDGERAPDRAEDVKGKVEETLGWLTGDRTEEAKGRLRRAEAQGERDDEANQPEDPQAAEAVRDATDQVRDEKGELG